jgi:uncharacterized protein (TIGR02466 family)
VKIMIEPSLAVALFPTPIVVIDLPDMKDIHREITAVLLAEENTVPSWQRANVGGWHSTPDLSGRPEPGFRALMRAVVDAVSTNVAALAEAAGVARLPQYRYAVTAWAMVMRDGHYVMTHDHGDAHWSVAYYVDAGDAMPAPSGHLAFLDPRRSGRMIPGLAPGPTLFPSTFDIAPRTGALVIFPGWLQHYVHAYRGQRPRICVSCNLAMEVVAPPAP